MSHLLMLVLLAFVITVADGQRVEAQGGPEGCHAFESGIPGLSEDKRLPIDAVLIMESVQRGCPVAMRNVKINGPLVLLSMDIKDSFAILDSTFTDRVFFGGVSVSGQSLDFTGSHFLEFVEIENVSAPGSLSLVFNGAIFDQALIMKDVFAVDFEFEGARALANTDFFNVRFSDATFKNAVVEEVSWDVSFEGSLWPPNRISILNAGLTWELVKNTKPADMRKEDFFGLWENLFTTVGNHSDVRSIRITRRHSTLMPIVVLLPVSFFVLLFGFWGSSLWLAREIWWQKKPSGRYGIDSGQVRNLFLINLDIMTPGIDFLASERHKMRLGTFQSILFVVQRFLGWGALGVAGAVIVAWLIE